jgi:hypothetical protein
MIAGIKTAKSPEKVRTEEEVTYKSQVSGTPVIGTVG